MKENLKYIKENWKEISVGVVITLAFYTIITVLENVIIKIALIING